MLFVTKWMNLEIVIVNEVSQIQKDKHDTILLTFGIFLT